MRITTIKRTEERQILTAMIVDNTVLSRITSKWDKGGFFKSKWSNLIGGWCVKYFNTYEKAPMKQIESLFDKWARKTNDKETVRLVEKFLGTLSDEYESIQKEINSQYIIDLAGRYFNKVKIEKLVDTLQSNLDIDKIEDANNQLINYNQIELGAGETTNIFEEDIIKEAFEAKQKPLIVYPGALGKFFKGALERDAFIAVLAGEKKGKSWWLLDMAFTAIEQQKKVAFFEAGDMSRNQIIRRMMVRVAKHPIKRSLVQIPISIERGPDENHAKADHRRKRFKKGLRYTTASKAAKKYVSEVLKSEEPLLKLSCHANSTLSVRMMKSILKSWEREGWVPDIIIIDYSDILDMSHPTLEGRDCINNTWKQLRGMSQQYHCLVVTATQANAASYSVETLERKHFSEDKRKLAHVTGMFGINFTSEEKEMGIMRLNWIALRESEYDEKLCVNVATCLELGRTSVLSCF